MDGEIVVYSRPLPIKAVQVTEENVIEVSEWCKGTVVGSGKRAGILIPNSRNNGKNIVAKPGDWVLLYSNRVERVAMRNFGSRFTMFRPHTRD